MDRVLVAILLAGLGLRLVEIGAPLIDQQAWRQTDTAAIARNYLEEGLDRPFHPRVDWRGDTLGYVEMNFPLFPYSVAVLYAAAGGDTQTLDQVLDKAFAEGTSPIGILRVVQRHLQNLHFAIAKVEAGLPADKALQSIRPPVIFKFKSQFQSQMRQWRQDRLAKALELITETEMDCKSTGFPAAAGCHRALMRVAQAARARS